MIIDLPVRPGLRILVTARPVDFRRGIDSLPTLVKERWRLIHSRVMSSSSDRNVLID